MTNQQLDDVMPDAWMKTKTSEGRSPARKIAGQSQAAA